MLLRPHTRLRTSAHHSRGRSALISCHADMHSAPPAHATKQLQDGDELDEAFTGLDGGTSVMTVAGFGSLLSERSARTTFPNLQNFRPGRLYGYRRVFAHTADIFFERGIANTATAGSVWYTIPSLLMQGEIGSLSCEHVGNISSNSTEESSTLLNSSSTASNQPVRNVSGTTSSSNDSSNDRSGSSHSSSRLSLVVSLFEVPYTPDNVAAFIEREHEFRFLAVRPYGLDGQEPAQQLAVLCGANTDEHYKIVRCPPEEWQRRWGQYGISSVWSNDVLPCRVYLRHCVLAAKGLNLEAYQSFLDNTYLSDRVTTIRQYLEQHPEIMDELPPPELVGRYSG